MGYQNGTEEKDPCCQARPPEFSPWDPHGRRKEHNLASCPLTSTLILWHGSSHVHTYKKLNVIFLTTYFMITMSTNRHSLRELYSLSFQKKSIKQKRLTKSSLTQCLLFQYDFVYLEDQCTCESWNIVKSLKLHCFIHIHIFSWPSQKKQGHGDV